MSELLQSLSGAFSHLVGRAAPGVVSVLSQRTPSSGFVWRPGFVVTADEALAEDGDMTVELPGGETVSATLAGRDAATDIALLRIDRPDLPSIPLATEPVAAGALVVAVGARAGSPVAALGLVALASPAWRSMRGGEIDARIELDVALRRSSEGGLVLGPGGAAFGMAVFGPRRRVLVIPAATIERVAARLQAHGRVARGYLGLGLQPVRLPDGGSGAMVMSVDLKGPGRAADLRQGDIIVTWNGQPIRRIQTMLRALAPDSVGQVVRLGLLRAGAPMELGLTIAERPEG